ncbi:hypothetical protein IWT25_00725 [Secundilactobacillus pentosiphilus]|uniref:Uncharacterized protein n=1 Tax=Secundilactobacillus pentosiphilus TaxID=1714682 RepID=A0A1Z5IVF5_9LACO|nr:hypothetical protein [Secundilactobacillus pentosiphilus]GAX05421.1 hypothetical protein IWT25_00725 [Secundilactobacillus pentosiphilus]
MRVTISRGDEWYKDIELLKACHLIGCKGWQLKTALDDDNEYLRGWKIRKAAEIYKGVFDK